MNDIFNKPRTGWQCPVCNKVHAPFVAACDCHELRDGSVLDKYYTHQEMIA